MNDDILTYEFAPAGGGMEDGFNNPAIEYFVGNPSYYLARESIQNILDATPPGSNQANAKFSSFDIKGNEIPEHKKLVEIISACNLYETENPKAKIFYQHAQEVLRGDSYLNVLRIDDFNTTGMSGADDDRKGNYHKFMKSFGSSGKTIGSGGSFGLGKAAYYAASNFRMIFVSSIYEENEKSKYMFQGKLLLNSFSINGDIKRGDGSFGLSGQKAVRNLDLVPEIFKRDEIGTSIFIISFRDNRYWKENILHSVLENFWPAISDGLINVEVGGTIVDDNSIREIMEREYSLNNRDSEKNQNPLPYFLSYHQKDPKMIYEKKLDILGNVQLSTLLESGLPNKTEYARSIGMIVQKNRRYYCSKDHASFFYCKNREGSEILKRMENPRHDEWRVRNGSNIDGSPDRDLIEAEKELREFIKEAHDRFGSGTNQDYVDIPNLEQYLYCPADNEGEFNGEDNGGLNSIEVSTEETGSETGALQNELKNTTPKPKIKPVKSPVEKQKIIKEPDGSTSIFRGGVHGGNDDRLDARLSGSPDENGQEKRVLVPVDFRSFHPSGKNDVHIITLKDIITSNTEIEIYAITEKGLIPLLILDAEDSTGIRLKSKKNKIIGLQIDGKVIIKIRFEERGKYSLSVKVYEIK